MRLSGTGDGGLIRSSTAGILRTVGWLSLLEVDEEIVAHGVYIHVELIHLTLRLFRSDVPFVIHCVDMLLGIQR